MGNIYPNLPTVISSTTPVLLIDSNGNAINGFSGTSGGVTSVNSITGAVTIAGAGTNSVTNAGSTVTVSGVQASGANVGTGEAIFKQLSGSNLQFKSVLGAGAIGVTSQANTITISATGIGTGDVVGPSSATDNAIARFSTTTGKLIKNSSATIDNGGVMTVNGAVVAGAGTLSGTGNLNLVSNGNIDATAPGAIDLISASSNVNITGRNNVSIGATTTAINLNALAPTFGAINLTAGANITTTSTDADIYNNASGNLAYTALNGNASLGASNGAVSVTAGGTGSGGNLYVNSTNSTAAFYGGLAATVASNGNIDVTAGQYMTLTSTNADIYLNASGNCNVSAVNGNAALNAALNTNIGAGLSVGINASAGNITATAAGDVNLNANAGSVGVSASSAINLNSVSGINTAGSIVPMASGVDNLGSSLLPFSGTYSNQFATSVNNSAISMAAVTVDWNLGSSAVIDFTGQAISGTIAVALANGINGSTYTIKTINNGTGDNTITWGSGLKWSNGTVGNLTPSGAAIDLFTLYFDGSDFLSSVSPNFI